jgi:hypothetical protein
MPPVPLSIPFGFFSRFPLPLSMLRAVSLHELLREEHVAVVVALPAQAELFLSRDES